ncbi:hypothetical protein FB45DRAFT_542677 [Roridomyces roridus]|uniref:Ino eighty subunit 1 n=1 Tax=Roridomyces roridus TaxID=1738132 RepID=A0AAD7FNM6_9AGAR|nr:hypothetical protein FB45DRAFT_542677 [Roridomyces roridus]
MATILVQPASWPPEPLPPVGYLSRKALPIKRNDAEPLTREDIQYDFLNHIFHDNCVAFSLPMMDTANGPLGPQPCTFREIYVNAIYRSSKCSKVIKDKMVDTPAFGIELAKISLLVNIGRVNSTLAFFPEMKTALRTYHPIPSLQKTDGNAQDAPRIKNCLKAALLASEFTCIPPSRPDQILEITRGGQRPPTSVVNLIFVLANHAAPLSNIHFDGDLNFLDLFLPKPLSSKDRANVFLWLMYHYLENPDGPNPYDDSYSRQHPGKAPRIRKLTEEEHRRENVDTAEEVEWGKMMTTQRNGFLQRLVSDTEREKKSKAAAPHFVTAPPDSSRPPTTQASHGDIPTEEASFMYYVPNREPAVARDPPFRVPRLRRVYQPSPSPERSMLEQAWHTVTTHDPLDDSDEESQDEHITLEYTRRLNVITRLRGRITPEPPEEPVGRLQKVSWD